jgi:5,10-methylenetetrahydromethanopterin reductase
MTALGVAFDGRAPLSVIPEQARVAEAGGARTLWVASHLFLRDPVTTAHLALAATSHLRVALMAMSPYSVHPVFIAMAAAALEEVFPGRVTLCLGVGAPGDLAAAGIEAPKPLTTLREAIRMCRGLFAGEGVKHEGEVFKLGGRRLAGATRPIPIVLAASGPQMLEMSGIEADGVLISAATSTPFVRWCLDLAEQGLAKRAAAGGAAFQRCGIVYTRVGDDAHGLVDSIRRTMGFILRGAHHAKNLELAGSRLDQKALFAAYAKEDWATVEALVTDDVVQRHAAVGLPAQVGSRYGEYAAAGLDEVIVGGIDDTRGLEAALAAARRGIGA